MNWLALDIGGANLKVVGGDGRAVSAPFALWRRPQDLASKLVRLAEDCGPFDAVAMTMTAELCDCFTSKREGVVHVLDATARAAAGRPVRVWTLNGGFVDPAEARREPEACAASNWLALASWVADRLGAGPALLVDCGSTTTDVVPLADGVAVPRGRTDTQRLASGGLVYLGVVRTPLCAVADAVTHRGRATALMAEWFATSEDVFVLLGDLPPQPRKTDTADGRPLTIEACAARIMRMVGADLQQMDEAVALAGRFEAQMRRRLATAVQRVCADRGPDRVVVSGSGAFLARRAVRDALPGAAVIDLQEQFGADASHAACALALQHLAKRHFCDGV